MPNAVRIIRAIRTLVYDTAHGALTHAEVDESPAEFHDAHHVQVVETDLALVLLSPDCVRAHLERVKHNVHNRALRGRAAPIHRPGPCDIRAVAVQLAAGVHQEEVAALDELVVAVVVHGHAVRARRAHGRVCHMPRTATMTLILEARHYLILRSARDARGLWSNARVEGVRANCRRAPHHLELRLAFPPAQQRNFWFEPRVSTSSIAAAAATVSRKCRAHCHESTLSESLHVCHDAAAAVEFLPLQDMLEHGERVGLMCTKDVHGRFERQRASIPAHVFGCLLRHEQRVNAAVAAATVVAFNERHGTRRSHAGEVKEARVRSVRQRNDTAENFRRARGNNRRTEAAIRQKAVHKLSTAISVLTETHTGSQLASCQQMWMCRRRRLSGRGMLRHARRCGCIHPRRA